MPDEKPKPAVKKPATPVLRADATDDDLGETDEAPAGTVEKSATRIVCAVCGLDAGTCGHQTGLTCEVAQ